MGKKIKRNKFFGIKNEGNKKVKSVKPKFRWESEAVSLLHVPGYEQLQKYTREACTYKSFLDNTISLQ